MVVFKNRVTYSEKPNHAARSAHAKGARAFQTYDTSYIRPKRDKKGTIIGVIAALILLVVLVFGAVKLFQGCSKSDVVLLGPNETASVVVTEGESAKDVGASLVEARLISNAGEFTRCVKSKKAGDKLKAGTYTIAGGLSVDEIVDILMAGTAGAGFTVAEGATIESIALTVEDFSQGAISADDFKTAASDASVYASHFAFLADAGTNSLEGFLFPKTYELQKGMKAEDVIHMMLEQFASETANLDWSYPKSQGLSVYDAVNLASIVEKEASADTVVRAKVAAVFYNRLSSNSSSTAGFLQSDATTAYEVKHDPTPEEVHADTPYSTYTHKGLPPTPICSPGLECLSAVCSPDEESLGKDFFFYFEPNDKGGLDYHFTETYDDHMSTFM